MSAFFKGQFRMWEVAILASACLAIAAFGLLNAHGLWVWHTLAILEGASTDNLMVIGMTVVIVCGAFDMSIGSAMPACGLAVAMSMNGGIPAWLAVTLALLTGALINGTVVTRPKTNPFITTLGTTSILRGIVLVVARSSPPTGFPESSRNIAWGSICRVSYPTTLLAVAMIVGDALLRSLSSLQQVYFVGSNEEAAHLTGIRAAWNKQCRVAKVRQAVPSSDTPLSFALCGEKRELASFCCSR